MKFKLNYHETNFIGEELTPLTHYMIEKKLYILEQIDIMVIDLYYHLSIIITWALISLHIIVDSIDSDIERSDILY